MPGADIGARLYAGKKRMFKGHKWERQLRKRRGQIAVRMRDMAKRIQRFKSVSRAFHLNMSMEHDRHRCQVDIQTPKTKPSATTKGFQEGEITFLIIAAEVEAWCRLISAGIGAPGVLRARQLLARQLSGRVRSLCDGLCLRFDTM